MQKAFTSGLRGSGRIFASQEGSEKGGGFAPTEHEPVVAEAFVASLDGNPACHHAAREATVLPRPVTAPAGLVCPAQSLEWPPLTITSSPSTTQEAKWAAAHKPTVSPGTEGTSPVCGLATGGPSMPQT